MGRWLGSWRIIGLAGLLAMPPVAGAGAAVTVRSPDGRAVAVVGQDPDGRLRWQAAWRGRTVLSPAPIALRFAGEAAPRLRIMGVRRRAHAGWATGLIGKATRARDRWREATIRLAGGPRPLWLVVRAYDDGVAYRWRFRTAGAFALADEQAGFGVPTQARVWAAPAGDKRFRSSYEAYYRTGPLARAAPAGQLVTLPLLVQRPAGAVGITEAALHDWAGLYLLRERGRAGLTSHLSPRLDRAGVAVVGGAGEHRSPWRVALLADRPAQLIASNLVALLNPPPDARDWSWVAPGKTSFPWWNGYWWPGARFAPGLNTATTDAYIDFDAAHGIPFHTLDGDRDGAWYGGPIEPTDGRQDLTRARPGLDLTEILTRARARGVRLRLWCHWLPLSTQLDRAFATWERWGIAGVMVDFMDRDDQAMIAWQDRVAAAAAAHHLTVVLHGVAKPTGEARTWPNLLTREAVRGTEYDKWPGNPGSTASHEATTPFVRMLAGPMDIHEGGFAAVAPGHLVHREVAPRVIGTRARALATYIVEDNGLPMVADSPVRYAGAPEFAFVRHTPATWDETRVLAGAVGRYLVVARRRGRDWWLGAITDERARRLPIGLGWLGPGRWRLDGWRDEGETRRATAVTMTVDRATRLRPRLGRAGGWAAHLHPVLAR